MTSIDPPPAILILRLLYLCQDARPNGHDRTVDGGYPEHGLELSARTFGSVAPRVCSLCSGRVPLEFENFDRALPHNLALKALIDLYGRDVACRDSV
jgi:hypothetical protein